MQMTRNLSAALAGIAILLGFGGPGSTARAANAALTGQVSSVQEGAMEGVLVTAKRDGATIRISVVTDAQGRYGFPADRLVPGHYTLTIRAAGYDLDAPKTTDIAAGQTVTADLKLKPTANLAAQLTNADWMSSVPDSPMRRGLAGCTNCQLVASV